MREVICCSTSPSSSSLGLGSVLIHDIQSGSQLASFNQTSARAQCVAVIPTTSTLGGLIIAAQPDKPIVNVYTFQKEQLHLRIVLPEKPSCVAVDNGGVYCAAGTPSGRIYIWELASGILFNSFEAHYRAVTVLRFTCDGAALVSGSEDARVAVWTLARLLDNQLQQQTPTPHMTLSDHTLSVTDIKCGIGVFPHCRIVTSSLDGSCKLWDIATKSVLATFLFPLPIIAMAFDPSERALFAASAEGSIHQVNLYRQRKDYAGYPSGVVEAVGGLGEGDAIRVPSSEGAKASTSKRLIAVGSEVASLTLSLTGSVLLVGTNNGLIQLYDVPSHQLVRTINTRQGFPVTHLSTMIKPTDLVGQMNVTLGFATEATLPTRPIASFHRTRDLASRDAHEVQMMPLVSRDEPILPTALPAYDFARDHRFFTEQAGSSESSQSLQVRVAELEDELARVRQNLSKAKGFNDAMWDTVVSGVLGTSGGESGRTTKKAKLTSSE